MDTVPEKDIITSQWDEAHKLADKKCERFQDVTIPNPLEKCKVCGKGCNCLLHTCKDPECQEQYEEYQEWVKEEIAARR